MEELTEQEREELMACEFVVKGCWNGEDYTVPGRLIDIDSDIGITVVNKEDPTDYLRCLQGPASSVEVKQEIAQYPGLYEALFQEMVKAIRSGVMDLTKHETAQSFGVVSGESPSSENCAFNQ